MEKGSESTDVVIKLHRTKKFSVFIATCSSILTSQQSSSSDQQLKRKRIEKSPSSPSEEFTSRKESKWLSDQLAAATNGIQNINLSSKIVKDVLEEHLVKSRQLRAEQLQDSLLKGAMSVDTVIEKLGNLAREEVLHFDTNLFQLKSAFSSMLFENRDEDYIKQYIATAGSEIKDLKLEHLHEWVHGDKGQKKDRAEKLAFLSPMLNQERRAIFQRCYDNFVLSFILPSVEATLPITSRTGEHFYQAFPCTRVIRPGEFSLGPHSDCNYGFQAGNVNFYLPLVTIGGSNSLAIESTPGREDWHFLVLKYGEIQRFWGAMCTHFTPENTTNETRVSFDFRVIPGIVFERKDRYSETPGYYLRATLGSDGTWTRHDPIPNPDWRCGFPFVK